MRANPVGPTQGEIERASSLYREFRGTDGKWLDRVPIRTPKTGLVIGELDGVLYTTQRDGKREKYIHRFRRNSRPLLIAAHDGKSLHILGGEYEFTERGIVDR